MPLDEYTFLPNSLFNPQDRKANYDVCNEVDVSSPTAVRDAVKVIFKATWPNSSFDQVWLAFYDFERLFNGLMPGYDGCDTVYHDIQHSLDMSLCTARLLAAHDQQAERSNRLGPERATIGMIIALFHDAGYLRSSEDDHIENGAEYTLWHIARGANFLRSYLPSIGMSETVNIAGELVHFTGYEKDLDDITLEDPKDYLLGHMIGTADLLVQMADRCYLEKCRDHLYLEFVLAGIAIADDEHGLKRVFYQSGEDLLRQTPDFYRKLVLERLENSFGRVYQRLEFLYDGRNPYIECIERSIGYLEKVIANGQWSKLRRKAACKTILPEPVASSNALVNSYLHKLRNNGDGLLLS
ncbi:MAG: hypothetical protein P8R04_02040 [Gammaproteobacteria bacterium]|nr:hypothetical protein [Gammaproteobacteria bacterium]